MSQDDLERVRSLLKSFERGFMKTSGEVKPNARDLTPEMAVLYRRHNELKEMEASNQLSSRRSGAKAAEQSHADWDRIFDQALCNLRKTARVADALSVGQSERDKAKRDKAYDYILYFFGLNEPSCRTPKDCERRRVALDSTFSEKRVGSWGSARSDATAVVNPHRRAIFKGLFQLEGTSIPSPVGGGAKRAGCKIEKQSSLQLQMANQLRWQNRGTEPARPPRPHLAPKPSPALAASIGASGFLPAAKGVTTRLAPILASPTVSSPHSRASRGQRMVGRAATQGS